MKTIKWIKAVTLVAVLLLAVSSKATDAVAGYSGEVELDTRSMSRVLDVDAKPIDSRSYTIEWSIVGTLNTKKIIGTHLLIR
ncbi:MAG: hypothetical protein PHO37_16900 [Kiritimatiellae bacterium]|nr:hypothetical protein [Kiritimatiellia bacterium]